MLGIQEVKMDEKTAAGRTGIASESGASSAIDQHRPNIGVSGKDSRLTPLSTPSRGDERYSVWRSICSCPA